jgi:hypothetical protein
MAIPKFIQDSQGSWKGTSELNLPWLPKDKQVSTCDSKLHVEIDPGLKYATIHYVWAYEGKREEGTMIICGDKKEVVEIGWSDSWHMNSGVMHLKGKHQPQSLKTLGSYTAEEQTWGWSVAFEQKDGVLLLKMENIPPGMDPQWAVEAEYRRE